MPVIFIQGKEDLITTTAEVREWYDRIESPHKRFVELDDAGHFAIFRQRHAFLDALVTHVRPLAMENQ
jgi:pimeloyl-ACP methyl ester carboxylesterase